MRKMICQNTFDVPPNNVDIDYIYEPYIRAKVLLMAFNGYVEHGEFHSVLQLNTNAETYYIIHSMIKHLALNCVRENRREN